MRSRWGSVYNRVFVQSCMLQLLIDSIVMCLFHYRLNNVSHFPRVVNCIRIAPPVFWLLCNFLAAFAKLKIKTRRLDLTTHCGCKILTTLHKWCNHQITESQLYLECGVCICPVIQQCNPNQTSFFFYIAHFIQSNTMCECSVLYSWIKQNKRQWYTTTTSNMKKTLKINHISA